MSARQTLQDMIVQHPSEFLKIPGYASKIDHKVEVFEDVLTHHHFKQFAKCSIESCGTNYKDGYLLLWQSGAVSNVGNCCAAKYLGEKFTNRLERYQQERELPRLKAQLVSFKLMASGYRGKAESVRAKLGELALKKRALEKKYPLLWKELVLNFRERSYEVTYTQETEEPIFNDEGEDTGRTRLKREIRQLGEIRGLEYLREHPLASLQTHVFNTLDRIEKASLGDMSFKMLHLLGVDAMGIDHSLANAEQLANAGEVFFSKNNAQLIRKIQGSRFLEVEARAYEPSRQELENLGPSCAPIRKALSRKEKRALQFIGMRKK